MQKISVWGGLGGGQLFMHADGVTKTLPTYDCDRIDLKQTIQPKIRLIENGSGSIQIL